MITIKAGSKVEHHEPGEDLVLWEIVKLGEIILRDVVVN